MRNACRVLAIALLALGCSATAPSEPPRVKEGPASKQCLSLVRIFRTEIVDDRTILFHMRDGAIWRNQLPHTCYGLRMQGGFGYSTPLDRVCDREIIQVLGGAHSVCGLGRFEPYAVPTGVDENDVDAAPDAAP